MSRDGPKFLTYIDIDGCIWIARLRLLRLIEHKQLHSGLGEAQHKALGWLDAVLHFAVRHKLIDPRSGVFQIRGQLRAADEWPHEVIFEWPQTVYKLNGTIVLEAMSAKQLFTWVNGNDPNWVPRERVSRIEYRRE